MDKKNQNIYKSNHSNKKDNLRNEIPFQNMLLNRNNIFQIGPVPNIVFVNTNFLNKKREPQELSSNDNISTEDKNKCKYLYLLILYIFFEIFFDFYQKIFRILKIYNIKYIKFNSV